MELKVNGFLFDVSEARLVTALAELSLHTEEVTENLVKYQLCIDYLRNEPIHFSLIDVSKDSHLMELYNKFKHLSE